MKIFLEKKGKWLFIFFGIIFLFSCGAVDHKRIRIKTAPVLDINKFEKVFISDFLIKSKSAQEGLNKEIKKSIKEELSISYEKPIEYLENIKIKDKESIDNHEIWKNNTPVNSAVLTGIINIAGKERYKIVKGEDDKNRLQNVKILNVSIDYFLISGDSGKVVFDYNYKKEWREFKERDEVILSRSVSIANDRLISRLVKKEVQAFRYLFTY